VSWSRGYVETAFKVTVEKHPEKMKCVPLGDIELDIGFVRSELRGKGCPSIIIKKGNEAYLCFLDSTQECSSYIKGLCKGGCPQKEIDVERADVEKLAHEVIRIRLMRHSYKVIKGKLVNVDSLNVIVPGYFNKFDAYKTSLTHFQGGILLAIDKSFKLEPGREAVTEVAISLNICEYSLILGTMCWVSDRVGGLRGLSPGDPRCGSVV
jgi:hypothetical protein